MKPINEQISPNFVAQARKLAEYTRILHKILPIECRNHVKVANIRQQNLILITDSPVWTTRIRQLSPQILEFLRQNETSLSPTGGAKIIHHVQVTTRYQNTTDNSQALTSKSSPKRTITEKTATLLSQSANSMKDQRLKDALLRVAKHCDNNTTSTTVNKRPKTD